MVSNKILAFLLLFGSSLCAKEIPQSNIISVDSDVRVFHTKNGFSVLDNGRMRSVRSENIDKELRGITSKELDFILGNKAIITLEGKKMEFTRVPEAFVNGLIAHNESATVKESVFEKIVSELPQQNYIKVIRYNSGDFGLHLKVNMAGGGAFGAALGCWVGKFVAHLVIEGTIVAVSTAVSVVATPAVGVTVGVALHQTVAPVAHTIVTVAAVAGGITLGAATGPA